MTPARLPFLVAALILAAAIVSAMARASFGESFGRIISDPWGLVTLIDLYCAFLVAGFVIWRFERSRPLAIGLVLLTLVLGSLVPLLWLAFRGGPLFLATRRHN